MMQADPALEGHLHQLEEPLLQPNVRKFAAEVSQLLAGEFIEFGSSGRIFDKQQIIASLRQIEVQMAQGKSLALACKEAEISEQSSRTSA